MLRQLSNAEHREVEVLNNKVCSHKKCYTLNENVKVRPKMSDNLLIILVRKRAKIRNRYNQAPHLAQDTN